EPSIVSSSATTDPVTGTIPQLLDGTGGVLLPGEQVVIEFTIEINPSLIPAMGLTNQVEATGTPTDGMGNPIPDPNNPGGTLDDVSDLSDSGNDPSGDNPDAPGDMGTPNDPTPLPPLPGISVTKAISAIPGPMMNDDGTFTVSFDFGIKNIGNTALSNIDLFEDFADQYGCAFIGNASDPVVTPVIVTGTAPTGNTSYEGSGIAINLLNSDGTLLPGDSIQVSVTVDLDPTCATVMSPLVNQAEVNGDPTEDDGTPLVDDNGMPLDPVSDLSDDATDIDGDGIPDNETGGTDDPTELNLPNIAVTKAVTDVTIQSDGDIKLTFELQVQNTGNTIITNISLLDTLDFLNSAMPTSQLMPLPVVVTNIDATIAPGASMTYDGLTDTELLDVTGELAPGEGFIVTLMVDVDPVGFAMIMPQPVTNQAVVSGVPVDEDGNPLYNPVTEAPYEVGDLTDLSDDGTGLPGNGDPTSDNMGAEGDGLGDNPNDDPTPITLPGLVDLTKALTTIVPATTPGNVLATYEFVITNIGGADFINISLTDDFANEFGSGFIGVTMAPSILMSVSDASSVDPTTNANFTGFVTSDNMLLGTDGVLAPGDSVTVTVEVELDLDQLPEPAFNQAEVSGEDPDGNPLSDLSDDNSDIDGDGNNDNETGGPDDPTPIPPFPDISIAKSVNDLSNSPTSPNHFYVTYRHIVQNSGNTILENLILTDDMITALQGGYVGTIDISVLPGSPAAQMNPTASAATTVMDGVNNALDGVSGILNPGEQFIVDITVEIDITMITGTQPLLNQSTIEGTPTDGMGNVLTDPTTGAPYQPGDVTDISDSGTDPDGSNPGAPNDSGGFDDPTPLTVPGTIAVVKTISATAPAASGVFGNYDVTIDFTIENTGGNELTNIQLADMLAAQWGSAYVGVVSSPVVTTPGADAATIDPTPNMGYDGDLDANLLNEDGALAPDEFIVVQVVVEIDASESPAIGLENQATTTGTDPLGNEVTDLSDDNTSSTDPADPDGDNPNGAGNDGTGDTNNPSPLLIPEISTTKEVANAVPAASGTMGHYDVTYSVIVQNTGTTPLENILLEDDLATQLAPAYIGVVSEAMIVSSSATMDPMTGSIPTLLDGTAGVLLPGEMVVLEFTIEIDPSLIPTAGLNNQVEATGTPTDGMGNPIPDPNNPGGTLADVTDLSDTGNDPTGTNPDAPGDMGTPDDPTPLPPLPAIGVAKQVDPNTPAVPAASGVQGNWDVTYVFVVQNIGNDTLTGVSLVDDFATQMGGAFVSSTGPAMITGGTAAMPGGTNPSYTGQGLNIEMLDGTGVLAPGETIELSVTVEIDPNNPGAIYSANGTLDNQATATGTGSDGNPVMDVSDDGTDPNGDNPGEPGDMGTTDDPTPLLLPDVGLAKTITNVQAAVSGTMGNFDVTFKLTALNIGNDTLSMIALADTLDLATQLGGAAIAVVSPPVITMSDLVMDPSIDNSFDVGQPAMTSGTDGIMAPGQGFMIEFVVEVDPDAAGAQDTLANQAHVSGTGSDGTVVMDASDSGTDPEGNNPNEPGDTGGPDDPVILSFASIGVAKQVDPNTAPVPASSGVTGNWDVKYVLLIQNTGTDTLTNVSLEDNIATQMGGAYVGVVAGSVMVSGGTAYELGDVDATFTGAGANTAILDGTGAMAPGENIEVMFVLEIDPDNPGAIYGPDGVLENQATATGTDPNGGIVTDLSDDGADPTGDNGDGDNMDPTPVILPDIGAAKAITDVVDAASGIEGNYDVTLKYTVQNTGNARLNNLSLMDDIVGQWGSAYVGITSAPEVTMTTAESGPTANTAYAGTGDLLVPSTTDSLAPGQNFMIEVIVEVDISEANGDTLFNQAEASGETEDGMMVQDSSDNGTDPTGMNGDDNAEDPTPLVIPSIGVAKAATAGPTPRTGEPGRFDVTYSFIIQNTGNDTLTNISLVDNFFIEFDGAYGGVVDGPTITGGTATMPGTANADFTGFSPLIDMLSGDGILAPSETIELEVTVILDGNAANIPDPVVNQATVTGTDSNGDEVMDHLHLQDQLHHLKDPL
ncbi:MAG: hypothetical protein AAGK97_00470, partial [Bacteroidota bacterium]